MRWRAQHRRAPQGESRRALAGLLLLAIALATLPARAGSPPPAVAERLHAAHEAYAAGGYAEALEGYRSVLTGGWVSARLFYDLGCAAHKAGEPGWSVAYFEEARRRAPRDPEIRHNLRLVLRQAQDRYPLPEGSWLLGLLATLLDAYRPSDAIAALLVLGWLAALAVALGWLFPERGRALRRGVRIGLPIAALLVVAAVLLKAYQVSSAPTGVVVGHEVGVRAGPREAETLQFVLQAGAFLRLGRQAGEWWEVAVGPELRGWVPADQVTRLSPPRWVP